MWKYRENENEFCEISPFPVWHTMCPVWLPILLADWRAEPTSALKTKIASHHSNFFFFIPTFKSCCSHRWCQNWNTHGSVFRSQVKFAVPWIGRRKFSLLPLKNLRSSARKVSRINLQLCYVLWVIVESWVLCEAFSRLAVSVVALLIKYIISLRAIYVIPERIIQWQKEHLFSPPKGQILFLYWSITPWFFPEKYLSLL